jgi:hypothetical protein
MVRIAQETTSLSIVFLVPRSITGFGLKAVEFGEHFGLNFRELGIPVDVVYFARVSFEIVELPLGFNVNVRIARVFEGDSDLPPIALPLIISDSRPVEAWA